MWQLVLKGTAKMIGYLCLLVLIIHLVFLWSYSYSEIIRRATPMPLRKYIQLIPGAIRKPECIYDKIDLSKKGWQKTYKYSNSYVGLYLIDLYFENFSFELHYDEKTKTSYIYKGQLQIEFLQGADVLISRVIKGALDKTYSSNPSHRGFIVFDYSVPNDLPSDEEISLRITLLEGDEYLERRYGPAHLYVGKASDL